MRIIYFLSLFGVSLFGLNLANIKTGQTQTIYMYDDGYFQKGTTQYFSRDNNKGIVIDHLSKLMWQDTTSNKDLEIGWYGAIQYCSDLKLGGYSDWRVPSRLELFSLSGTKGKVFRYNSFDFYWSSRLDITSKEDLKKSKLAKNDMTGCAEHAYGVYFNEDNYIEIGHMPTFYIRSVRCVRGGENFKFGDLSRDDNLSVVVDNQSGLMWQDSKEIQTSLEGKEALDYCANLKYANFNDWRLPNINELLSISDDTVIKPAIYKEFKNTKNIYYWSSSIFSSELESKELLSVSFGYGGFAEIIYKQGQKNGIRCVRDKDAK
jgi:hypothetical protein